MNRFLPSSRVADADEDGPLPFRPASLEPTRTIVIRHSGVWPSIAFLVLAALVAVAVLLGHRAALDLARQDEATAAALAGFERKVQHLESAVPFDSQRRQKLLGMRDHILRVNPRAGLAEAYRYAELALRAGEKYPAVDPLLLLAIGSTVFAILGPRLLGDVTNIVVAGYTQVRVYDELMARLPAGTRIPPGTTGADLLARLPPDILKQIPASQRPAIAAMDDQLARRLHGQSPRVLNRRILCASHPSRSHRRAAFVLDDDPSAPERNHVIAISLGDDSVHLREDLSPLSLTQSRHGAKYTRSARVGALAGCALRTPSAAASCGRAPGSSPPRSCCRR